MKNYPIYIFAFFFLINASCYFSRPNESGAIVFDHFPKEANLKLKDLIKISDSNAIDGLLLYRDSLLFLRQTPNTSPYNFSLIDLKSKSLIMDILPTGRKPGSTLSFLSYGINESNIWVSDIIKEHILTGNIDSIGKEKSDYIFRELPIPTFYYSLELMSDNNTVVGSGDYDSQYKINIVDLSKKNIIKQGIPYSKDSTKTVNREEKMAYESFLFLKPVTNDKCVLACRYADQIELIDLNEMRSKIVKGPENFEPKVVAVLGNDGKRISTRGAETRYAFVRGKVTQHFIYLLYSGNNHESPHLHYGKYIYIYDWEGNPIRKITLDDYVLDFAVTTDDSAIYTFNPKSKYIQMAKLR